MSVALDAALEETQAKNLYSAQTMDSLSAKTYFQEITEPSEVLVRKFKLKGDERAELYLQLEQLPSEDM